jgi:hypothetical protein
MTPLKTGGELRCSRRVMVAVNKEATEPRVKLKSSLRKFYGRHHDLVDRYGISVSQMTMNIFTIYQGNPDRNHGLWNIVSTERYILHMQVLLECCYI